MADFCFNIALGKAVEYGARVNANDPAASIFRVAVLRTASIESDATLKDKDTFTDLVSGTTDWATNTNYAQKTISDSGGLTVTINDTSDRYEIDFPDQAWTAVGAGDGWNDIVIGYDPSASGDTTTVPISQHDFVLTPDGSDITMVTPANGFYWAT